ncbi:MAG TPA: biotin--[acetyl-CoA-carboxylase] ligase [Ignavibacteriaceae bacterium]|nr:biotin--[acetyl-CoA-carboxylase] ligase [Ignavibacteriaceae bacterium]
MFNIEAFDLKLNTEFIGRNFVYAEELSSTNSFLLDKNSNYNYNGTVVLAEKQSIGRGRMDRTWYSQKDQNLTFSILLKGNKKVNSRINLINFAATLSVAMSIENLYQQRTNLKWPNDVLLSGKKVSGILLESTSSGSRIERIVVGIGINVNQSIFQGKFNIEPTSIRNEINDMVDRERFLAEVLNNFEWLLTRVTENDEFILKEWRERCNMLGERITVSDGTKTQYGIFEDIDDSGFLLLKTKEKVERIHFGDVSIV